MKKTRVKDYQSWFDLAIQETGSLANLFSILQTGDRLDIDPAPGRITDINPAWIDENKVVTYYASNSIKPATGLGNSIQGTVLGCGNILISANGNLININN